MSEESIEGHVAAILNERELIINIGSNAGVEVGMKFKILSDSPTDITDPITGEKIGELNLEKVRVRCTKVEQGFSICSTYVLRHQAGLLSGSSILYRAFYEDRDVVETLRFDTADKPAPLNEEDSYVKKGDRCVQIIEDEKIP